MDLATVIEAHLYGGPRDGEVRAVPDDMRSIEFAVLPPMPSFVERAVQLSSTGELKTIRYDRTGRRGPRAWRYDYADH